MKRDRILYWIFTGLIALGFTLSSLMYFSSNPQITEGFKFLGYPQYLIPLLGIAKLAGALALLNPWSSTLKEWAYAGITFMIIGATWSHIATNTPFTMPLLFLAVLALSYIFYTRTKNKGQVAQQRINKKLAANIALD
jgi:uncharacterized membrane protein